MRQAMALGHGADYGGLIRLRSNSLIQFRDNRLRDLPGRMFEIEVDRFNAMLITKGTGVWTVDTARAFLAAERAEIADLGVAVSDLLILFDASEFSVQDEAVLHLLRDPANPLYNARRGAFVTPTGLGMQQIEQGTAQPHIRVFETLSEAWLFLRTA